MSGVSVFLRSPKGLKMKARGKKPMEKAMYFGILKPQKEQEKTYVYLKNNVFLEAKTLVYPSASLWFWSGQRPPKWLPKASSGRYRDFYASIVIQIGKKNKTGKQQKKLYQWSMASMLSQTFFLRIFFPVPQEVVSGSFTQKPPVLTTGSWGVQV